MDYNTARAQYEQAYQEASPATRSWLDGFMESSANYMAVDQMNDRSVEQYLTRVYEIGKEMADSRKNGVEYSGPSASPRASTKNIFNGYSREENTNNANQLFRLYLDQNRKATSSSRATSSGTESPSINWSHYQWDKGWKTGWGFDTDSLESKIMNFATNVYNNLDAAVKHLNAGVGNKVYGIKDSDVATYKEAHRKLGEFIQSLPTKKIDSSTVKELADIVMWAGVDPVKFKEYFNDYLPRESQASRNLKVRQQQGYNPIEDISSLGYNAEVQKYLADNKIKLMRDDANNVYAFNEDYSAVAPLEYLNTDWRTRGLEGSTFGQGIFSDANGKVWYGDSSTLTPEDAFYEAVQNYKDKKIKERRGLFTIYNDFNPQMNYTDESKAVHDFVNRLGAAANIKHNLNNFVDVSSLFDSKGHVIAVNDNGSPWSDENLETGTLEFRPDTWFYYIDQNGELAATRWDDPELEQKIGKYNPNGWKETDNQIGSKLKGIQFSTPTTITGDRVQNPQEWATRMLDLLDKRPYSRTASDVRELEAFDGLKNPENILAYIGSLLESGIIKLDDNSLKKWFKQTEKYRVDKVSTKSVISDEDADAAENQKLIEAAEKAGYSSVADYMASQRKGFSTTEWMRLGALAADIASLGASFAPGGGTIASGILGLGASGTDFAADIMQDGFQWKDLGTLGVNIGLDVVGLLPGGKSLKITKNAVKVISRTLPLLIGLWSAYADGDKYIAAAKKLTTEDPKNMTAQDWQTLGRGLMLLTGTVRTGKATYGAYRSAGKAVGSGVKKGYNYIAEPIRRDKKAAEIHKERKAQDARGEKRGAGGWKRGQQQTEQAQSGTRRNSDPYMVEEKQGGKLDRFGEYLKAHK